jgi:hypothetical protein
MHCDFIISDQAYLEGGVPLWREGRGKASARRSDSKFSHSLIKKHTHHTPGLAHVYASSFAVRGEGHVEARARVLRPYLRS